MDLQVVIRDNQLSQELKDKMWEVYQPYYSYTKEYFMDRVAKNNYYSFYMNGDQVVGFTGLRINEFNINGENYFTIYFGQTVIKSEYRGSSLIQKTGIKLSIKFFHKLVSCKSFFWADALTFRSYLVFAKTLEQYYPSFREEMPEEVKQLRDYIGQTHYPETFCAKTGTVIKTENVVTDTSAKIDEKHLADPDIAFFAQTNKNHAEGHGLITMGPINTTNLIRIAVKIVKRSVCSLTKSAKIRTLFPENPQAA